MKTRPVRGPGLLGFEILAISRSPRALTRRPPTILKHALSQSAFAPSSPGAPPFVFDPNFRVPPDALARLIAALLQTEQIEAAWAICERARQSGYNDPLIEMDRQKVAAARSQPGIRDHPRE